MTPRRMPEWLKRDSDDPVRMKSILYYRQLWIATPGWANHKVIADIYRRSDQLGRGFCVDHIVPLKNPYVCGLHCEDNLQIIPVVMNQKKSNLFWPDSWNEQGEFDFNDMFRGKQLALPI